jgi:hypothetical protein
MGARVFVPLVASWVIAAARCSSSMNPPPSHDVGVQACSSRSAAPISTVPPLHRPVASTCPPTPASDNPNWPYADDGIACTRDEQCQPDAGLSGRCLAGHCTADECLTDDDCGPGRLCHCGGGTPNAVIRNQNVCLPGNCRIDADCGAGGFCMPSESVCGWSGYYCHTAADTCVDPNVDCPSSCVNACTYFPDRHAFACMAPYPGGC